MKKIIAVILSLAVLLCAASAMAEAQPEGKVRLGTVTINGAFTLQCGAPEGYTTIPVDITAEHLIAVAKSEDPNAPVMTLSVAYDEQYYDVDRLNDLDQEALEELEQTFIVNDPGVEITYGETGYGTLLLIARHESETLDYISFFSIYKGYCVEFALHPSETAEDKNLTEDQLRISVDFLTDLDFIPANQPTAAAQVSGQTFDIADITDYKAETNEIEVQLKRTIVLAANMVKDLKEGDTLRIGQESIEITSLQQEDDGFLINDGEVELRISDNEVRAYMYEKEYTETSATLTVPVEDDLVFLDGIDPESGEPLDQPTEHTAAEFVSMLTAEGTVSFDSDNLSVTFDENGRLVKVERYYTPWQ